MSGRASSSSLSPLSKSYGRRNRSVSPRKRYGSRGRRSPSSKSPSPSPRRRYGKIRVRSPSLRRRYVISRDRSPSPCPRRRYVRRARSPSPCPRRRYVRRARSPSPSSSRRYGRRGRSPSPGHELTSLLVRNLSYDCRADDLREAYCKFGLLKDVYVPQNFHTRKPQSFGFVNFKREADAAEAIRRTDRKFFYGQRLEVLLTSEKRRRPDEMRAREIAKAGRYMTNRSSNCSSLTSSSPPRCRRSRSRSRGESSSLSRPTDSPEDDRRKTYRKQSRFPVRDSSKGRSRSPSLMSRPGETDSREDDRRKTNSEQSRFPVRDSSKSRSRSPSLMSRPGETDSPEDDHRKTYR